MKAYRGVIQDGVVVLLDGTLPEGAHVTVTIGEGELLRATISNALSRPRKQRIRLQPQTMVLPSDEPTTPETS